MLKSLGCLALFVVLSLSASATTPAQPNITEAQRALALRMVKAWHFEAQFEKMLQPYREYMSSFVDQLAADQGKPLSAEQLEVFNTYMQQMLDAMAEELDLDSIQAAMVDIYAATFSEQELTAFVTFFESPIGQTFVAKSPEVSAQLIQHMQVEVAKIIPLINGLVEEMTEALHHAH
ncbi:MAG: DUF2059 domain-containing protein [Opitutales bacterium]